MQNSSYSREQFAEDLRALDLDLSRQLSRRFAIASAICVALAVAFYFLASGWLNSISTTGAYDGLVVVLCLIIVHLCAGIGIITSLVLASVAAFRRNRAGCILFLIDFAICVRYVCLLAFTV